LEGIPLKRKIQKVAKWMRHIPSDDRESAWLPVGMALTSHFFEIEARALWDTWSERAGTNVYDSADQERVWRSFAEPGDNRGGRPMVSIGTICHLAKENGYPDGPIPPQNAGLFDDIINEELPPPGPEEFGLDKVRPPETPPALALPAPTDATGNLDFLTDEDEKKLPAGFRYAATDDGFITHIEYLKPPKKEDDDPEWVFLCSPIRFRAVTRDINGGGWGLHLLLRDPDNRWQTVVIAQAQTAEPPGLLKQLLHLGLTCLNRQKLLELLTFAPRNIRARACCAPHVGWQERPDGRPVFVLPDRTIGAADGEVVYQPDTMVKLAYGTKGTLTGWQDGIAKPAIGNSRLIFSLSAAFAGPLLRQLKTEGGEGGGFNTRGLSSTGKTTLLAAAGSAWGGGGTNGFVSSWRTTDNALEITALAHNHTLLCLDELAQIEPEAAGKSAYMLANGTGKSRSTPESILRRRYEWHVLFLSTGEISLADKVEEKGGKAAAGQQVRVVDIAADAGCDLGIFDTIHGVAEPADFANRLKRASAEHYGHAGPAFVERLVSDLEGALQAARASMSAFDTREVPRGADGQVRRVAGRFALVAAAGELATSWGILPWPAGTAYEAAARLFKEWIKARGSSGESLEMMNAIRQITRFIEAHEQTRFQLLGSDKSPSGLAVVNRLGFVKIPESERGFATALPGVGENAEAGTEGDGRLFYFFPEQFKLEVCKGIGVEIMFDALKGIGAIRHDAGRRTKNCRIPQLGSPRKFYTVAAGPLFSHALL
jgi:putative DNA primase/helicase